MDLRNAGPPGGGLRRDSRAQILWSGRDWHNDYASFALDLQDRLRGIADDRERRALLRRAIEPEHT